MRDVTRPGRRRRRLALASKRLVDIVGSTLALVLLSPVLVAIAILVRWRDGGPVLFRQPRVGRGGREFTILKFRTMRPAAPQGLLVTVGGDPRITPLGRRLRRRKLDELPQLINVLRGDMSLVGPRPEVRRYVDMFAADFAEILTMRPGLTDPTSLAFRDEAEVLARYPDPQLAYVEIVLPEKLRMARQYVATWSPAQDLRVLGRTIVTLIR